MLLDLLTRFTLTTEEVRWPRLHPRFVQAAHLTRQFGSRALDRRPYRPRDSAAVLRGPQARADHPAGLQSAAPDRPAQPRVRRPPSPPPCLQPSLTPSSRVRNAQPRDHGGDGAAPRVCVRTPLPLGPGRGAEPRAIRTGCVAEPPACARSPARPARPLSVRTLAHPSFGPYATLRRTAWHVVYNSACVDEICSVRRHTVVQLFLEALTRGLTVGRPAPHALNASPTPPPDPFATNLCAFGLHWQAGRAARHARSSCMRTTPCAT